MGKKFLSLFLGVLLLAVAVQGVLWAQSDDDDCPRGQGYWANHPDAWGVTSLVIGSQTYTQEQLLVLLPGGGGDASTILIVQLIAAKLNVANGVASPVAEALIQQADALLAELEGTFPYNIEPSSAEGQAMIAVAGSLDDFNSGAFDPSCPVATEEPTAEPTAEGTATPTPTGTVVPTAEPTAEGTATPGGGITIIIEGPVESININIITIYGIDIEVDPNDPILTIIQIGDLIRIEGNVDEDSPTLIIIAVIVVIVDVDVVIIDGGGVWRDDEGCGNPPPPWAPANGWRRRCEGGGNGGGMGMGDDDD
jgi:hypothetical protein